MPIKCLAIMPHGDSINPFKWSLKNLETKKALNFLSRDFCSKDIDLTIIISPHTNFISNQGVTINCSNKIIGNTMGINFEFFGDIKMYNLIRQESFKKFNIEFILEPISYMDFGALIPILYTSIYQKNKKICLLSIDPSMPIEKIKDFGFNLAQVLSTEMKNIAIIISCDQSHTHNENGPYGYSKYANIIDFKIKDLLVRNKIEKISLLSKTKAFVKANTDSLIPLIFLSGILSFSKFKSKFLSYELGELLENPEFKDYYGMITANFIT